MTQIQEPPPPSQPTERIERPAYGPGGFEPAGGGPSIGRVAAIALMLVAITLVAAGVGFLLAGGRLPSITPSPTDAPTAGTQSAPATPPDPTAAPPTAVPAVPTAAPAPTLAPTSPPKPTAPPPTVAPKPTDPPPPTAVPKPTDPPPAKPASAPPPAAQQGVHSPVRPGTDQRMAQIEGRVNEYFAALRDEDYARAQQVCCTPEWRARYPLDRWQRNFDGVSDLRLVGPPRYLKVEDQEIVLDTDYTFVSGGTRRTFTLRWTFKPVGSEWQADLAEAFPTAQ